MQGFETLTNQEYINLETFRKNGVGVKPPVWFVQEGSSLFVRTISNAGKVKRTRNNALINIAPCKADGSLLGEWLPAQAHVIKNDITAHHIDRHNQQKQLTPTRQVTVSVGKPHPKYRDARQEDERQTA